MIHHSTREIVDLSAESLVLTVEQFGPTILSQQMRHFARLRRHGLPLHGQTAAPSAWKASAVRWNTAASEFMRDVENKRRASPPSQELSATFLKSVLKACELLTSSRFSGLVKGSREEFNERRLQLAIEARASTSDLLILNWLNRHIEALTAAVERESRDDDDEERGSRFG